MGLVDTPGCHAAMARLDDHRDALRAKHLVETVGDLARQALLKLEPPGKGVDEPRELRDSDHAGAGSIGDVDMAGDRREMVLAGRHQRDRAEQDRLLIAVRLGKGPAKQLPGIDAIARKPFAIGARDPGRRLAQALAVGIIPRGGDEGSDRRFDLGSARPRRLDRAFGSVDFGGEPASFAKVQCPLPVQSAIG